MAGDFHAAPLLIDLRFAVFPALTELAEGWSNHPITNHGHVVPMGETLLQLTESDAS